MYSYWMRGTYQVVPFDEVVNGMNISRLLFLKTDDIRIQNIDFSAENAMHTVFEFPELGIGIPIKLVFDEAVAEDVVAHNAHVDRLIR